MFKTSRASEPAQSQAQVIHLLSTAAGNLADIRKQPCSGSLPKKIWRTKKGNRERENQRRRKLYAAASAAEPATVREEKLRRRRDRYHARKYSLSNSSLNSGPDFDPEDYCTTDSSGVSSQKTMTSSCSRDNISREPRVMLSSFTADEETDKSTRERGLLETEENTSSAKDSVVEKNTSSVNYIYEIHEEHQLSKTYTHLLLRTETVPDNANAFQVKQGNNLVKLK
ncbi:hypothetical protein FGB62_27g09 [Gracilaria domingensis]|nr:hypothetical protein FGB62_27g09 [Gracilaria domingensis]